MAPQAYILLFEYIVFISFLNFFRIRSVQALQNIDWTDRPMLNENLVRHIFIAEG